jgi:hypothetical protein
VNRTSLSFAKLLDKGNALLELRFALLELLHLENDGVQAGRFLLRSSNLLVQVPGFFVERPVPPAHKGAGKDENSAASDGHPLADGAKQSKRRRALLSPGTV